MDLEDPDRVAEWKKFAKRFNGPVPFAQSDDIYQCGGGVSGFAIDPAGNMSLCVLSHFETFDLRRGSLREGWDHFLRQVRRKKITRVTKCTACQIKPMCGMCPANGELENGDPESPVDFLCHVAHLRAKTMDIPVPPHGDCEYCEGGSSHALLAESLESLDKRASEKWMRFTERKPLFPVMTEQRSAGAGCCSCGR